MPNTLIISLIGAFIIVGALVTFAAFVHLIAHWSTTIMKRITAATIMTIYYVVSFFFCWPMHLGDRVFGDFSNRYAHEDNAIIVVQFLWWVALIVGTALVVAHYPF